MKAVFMGTPEFAVPTLQALIDHHEVLAVVTQPDKQRGRGKKMQFPPVKEKAVEYDIPVYQPQRARDEEFIEELKKPQPRCDRCCCLWTDLTRKYLKYSKVWMYQCSWITPSKIQRSSTNPVGSS